VAAPALAPLDSIGDNNSGLDRIEFVAQNEGFKLGAMLAVDLNNDNRLDIVYGGGESFQVQHGGVRMNMGQYSFAATQGLKRLYMSNFAAGDLNGDGFMDLVQAGWDFWGCYNAVLLNDGQGTLSQQPLTTAKNTSPACGIADIDNNGLPDYFFVGNGQDNSFYLQRHDRTFAEATARLNLPGGFSDPNMVYADFNNDQSIDIILILQNTSLVFTLAHQSVAHSHGTSLTSGTGKNVIVKQIDQFDLRTGFLTCKQSLFYQNFAVSVVASCHDSHYLHTLPPEKPLCCRRIDDSCCRCVCLTDRCRRTYLQMKPSTVTD
jgi:hypothetical protein